MGLSIFELVALIGLTLLPAALISYWIVGFVKRRAESFGLVDKPNERKVHTTPIPLGGGIGIAGGVIVLFALGTFAVWCLWRNESLAQRLPMQLSRYLPGLMTRLGSIWVLLSGGIVLGILGFLDDVWGLPWQPRLAIEFLVAGVVVYWQNLQLTAFINAPWFTGALSVFWIVLLINSFNMLDNMDALSGGVASIIALVLSIMLLTIPEAGLGRPQLFVSAMLLTLLGSILGFLKHNWPPATIFMGDAGSYFLGYWIAICTLLSTYVGAKGESPHAVLAPLCLLAIPLYDCLSVVVIRLREGRSPFQADKKHFSHRLVELGLTKKQAVFTIYLATLTCSLGALLLPRTDWVGACIVLAIVACMLLLMTVLESLVRRIPSTDAPPSNPPRAGQP
jgi:UDP-GlcNAc:undecaprenyl-phosphate/decaprenyl-phosphate GlcNAc-1-phosphate transferase